MRRFGVLGWPVAHSRSPAMHEAAFAAAGLDGWSYQKLPMPPELFAETVRALPAAGFHGVNVTIPHKEAALALATEATPRARAIGAANTLTFAAGALRADNTDAPGLIDALPLAAAGRSALVLGAGGSARAAAWALTDAGAASVRVWNRNPARAQALAADLGVEAAAAPEPADLLVHCTPAGLADPDTFKDIPLEADEVMRYRAVIDLVYRPGETALVAAALARGVPAAGGLEVLVAQGAHAWEAWTGRPAPRSVMRAAAAREPSSPR